MYRVIIADDEEAELQRLLHMFEKLKDRYEVVGSFENGFDALESGIPLAPDIIVTDIKMPYISGIDLIKDAKLELPLVQSVIISGYDSFDYAKQAISLGVCSYLSKPILFNELEEALDKAADRLEQLSKLQPENQVQDLSKSQLQDKDLSLLVTLKVVSDEFRKKLIADDIDLSGKYQRLVVFDSDDSENLNEQESLLQSECLKSLAECPNWKSYSYFEASSLVFFLSSSEPIPKNELVAILSEIVAKFERFLHLSVSCAVSEEQSENINYRKMYRHAKHALEYRTILGKGEVFLYEDLEKNDANRNQGKVDENEYRKLTYLVSYNAREEAKDLIKSLLNQISSPEYQDSYSFILSNILEAILRGCSSLGDYNREYQYPAEASAQLFSLKSKEDVTNFFCQRIDEVININQKSRSSDLNSSFDSIRYFIQSVYTDPDISIEDAAEELGYSVSYVSAILKKNGTTFTKLLTECRMNKAKELLLDNDSKVLAVAAAVGYRDAYYFSHCFKKYTGENPNEYRKHSLPGKKES